MSQVEAPVARVAALFTTPEAGWPMMAESKVTAEAGKGLVGDRYAEGKGTWSKVGEDRIRHVTFIEGKAIEAVNQEHGTRFAPEDTRRNVVTTGIQLNDLVGQRFKVGDVIFEGAELCDPCARPSILAKKTGKEGREGFREHFAGRGGIRAKVLTGGEIPLGATIEVLKASGK